MLLARMSEGRERSFTPVYEESIAIWGGRFDGGGKPGVEGAGAFWSLWAHVAAKIVKAHAAADDEHAFIAQRSEGAAGGDVQCRIE